ncbi:MAG: DUF1343 domain-containing protein [Lachnospiraceae bacterium]|nr:DUF1343 domain-containing protein [Lachnospiraceae bacterium]MBR5944142.1 DUF1343 domain-containing protein [Lachnospiraceae bacterium]
MVKLGIDRIKEYGNLLEGKRIGLITNYSGIDSRMIEDMDVFFEAGYKVSKLFTPEHGLYGAMDGASVDNSIHPKYKTPIISLYGDRKEPTSEDLDGLDVLVYDIQDVGLRYYTYIYTLAYCMRAAAKKAIKFVVLDRPNPLGNKVEGNRMKKELASFVGDYELPIRYGLTPGELGKYFLDYMKLELDYNVIPMDGYKADMKWTATGQLWNLPSPSIHTFNSNLCYVGGCFFEATNISEGRGTAAPFQIYGAPFVNMDEFIPELRKRIDNKDVAIRPRAFTPFWSKHAGKTCYGVEFIPLNDNLDFLYEAIITLKTFFDLYPNEVEFVKYADVARLSSLSGDETVNEYINGKISLDELKKLWKKESEEFEKLSESYRIYK